MWPKTNFEKKVFLKMVLRLRLVRQKIDISSFEYYFIITLFVISRKSMEKGKQNTNKNQGRKRSSVGSYTNSSLYELRAKKLGEVDTCASHRGTSPTSPRRKSPTTSRYRVTSPSLSRKSTAASPALSRKSLATKHQSSRKSSVRSTKKEESDDVLTFNLSLRTRKLYRFKNNFSDGASEESDYEGCGVDVISPRVRKKGVVERMGGGGKRTNKLSMPEIIIQDYSNISPAGRDSKKMAKLKMKALSQFSNRKTQNKTVKTLPRNKILALTSFRNGKKSTEYVEVSDSEVECSQEEIITSRDSKKMARIKMKALAQFSNKVGNSSPREEIHEARDSKKMARIKMKAISQFSNRKMDNTEEKYRRTPRTLPRNKILALTSIRNGRKFTEYVEDEETDNDEEKRRRSPRTLPRNKILALTSIRNGRKFTEYVEDDEIDIDVEERGKKTRSLPRNKILALTSIRNGRKFTEYVEGEETDNDIEERGKKARSLPRNKILAVTSFRNGKNATENNEMEDENVEHSDDISSVDEGDQTEKIETGEVKF